MLLYRPILAAYKQTTQPAARRYLLREFGNPLLHAEPDELLFELAQVRDTTVSGEPARLAAQVALTERSLRMNLSTRDAAREMGGLWTAHADNRALLAWMASTVAEPELARAAGAWLGAVGLSLARSAGDADRALLLAGLGELGPDVAGDPLREELVTGPLPAGAALGLARLGAAALEDAIPPAVQTRGLAACAPWLGPALAFAPSGAMSGLLTRLAKAAAPEVREAAAHALGALSLEHAAPLLDLFEGEADRFVRLNVILSLARLGVPGGRGTLRRFYRSSDPEIVRIALIRAAGRSSLDEVRPFLERALAGSPEEVAEALQSLVGLGASAPAFLEAARAAARSANARLMLHGLLALAIWAPDECFARVKKTFSGAPSATWFLATYVLRYLRTDQTVPLLQKLLKAFRGTELEEIAVSALCRHLDQPGALGTLIALARAGAKPAVLARMMTDLARHLPEDQAAEAADAIRAMLKAAPAQPGPLLVALGSLGNPGDLATLLPHLATPAAEAAVHGIELLMDPQAAPDLEAHVKKRGPAVRAALVALFRLGHARVPELLEPFTAAADEVPVAARAVVEMALSVRHARTVSRLAHLYGTLSDRAKSLPPPAERKARPLPAPKGSATDASAAAAAQEALAEVQAMLATPPAATAPPGPQKSRAVRGAGMEAVLERPRRPVAAGKDLPAIQRPPPEGTGDHVYAQLGRVFRGEGKPAGRQVALVLVMVALVVGNAGSYLYMHRAPAANPDETSRFSRFPPLYKLGVPGEPADNAVNPDDMIEASRDQPLRLATRIKDDQLEVRGKLKVGAIEFSRDSPPTAKLSASLQSGSLGVTFPRGTARITVEGARTIVEIQGEADLEMKESTFVMNVKSGRAQTFRGSLKMKTLTAGQGGEFLDGTPMGRIEDAAPSASP